METFNPKIGQIVSFKEVDLAYDPLCWPYIEILIHDEIKKEALFGTMKGCEECFTTISLVDFAQDILPNATDLKYAQA